MKPIRKIEKGISLIEVLVVIALTAIIIVALYDAYDTNLKIYRIQQQTATMDMRTRTAMEEMVSAIRMAGSNNRTAINLAGRPFVAVAETNRIRVVEDLPKDIVSVGGNRNSGCSSGSPDGDTFDICDLNGDGNYLGDDENENSDSYINDDYEDVTFALNGTDLVRTQFADTTYDPNGTVSCTGCESAPKHPSVADVLADNIEAMTFEYFHDSATPISAPVTGNDLFNIRIVRVTLDARTSSPALPGGQPHRLRLRSNIYLRNAN
jgi:hypothetical protein